MSYFRLGEGDVRRYAEGAPLNTDDRLLLEFNAPKSLYLQGTSDKILQILRKQATEAFSIEGSYDNAVEMAEGYLAQEGEENRAREYFVKALEIKPDDARSLLGIGLAYFKERHYQKSLEMFNKALLVKETPEALYWKKRVEAILSY